MAELPRLRVGLTLDSATFIRETNRVIDAVNNMSRELQRQNSQMARSFDGMQRGIDNVSRGMQNLTRLFQIGSFSVLARQTALTADSFTLLAARLRIFHNSAEEVVAVQQALIDISNRNRVSIQQSADLYTRLALMLTEVGVSSEQLLAVTEIVGQTIKISGTNAVSAAAGLLQFTQAMGSGVLRGDELRSVLEQLPGLSVAIARGMGITVGELRKLGKEGELTTNVVLNALLKQAPELEKQFAEIPVTVGDAFTLLRNSLAELVGDSDKAVNASREFARAIKDLADVIRSPGFVQGFQEFATVLLREIRREFDLLVNVVGFFKTTLQDLGVAARTAAELDAEIANLTANRETLARAAQEAGLAPESTLAVQEADKLIKSLTRQRAAMGEVAEAAGALQVKVKGTIPPINAMTGGTDELTGALKRLAEAGKILQKTSAVEERFLHRQEELKKDLEENLDLFKAMNDEELKRRQGQAGAADLSRPELPDERELSEPFKNALEDIQAEFTDTFEELSQGAIRSFEDIALAATDIFTRMAANIATLSLSPLKEDKVQFERMAQEIGLSSNQLRGLALAPSLVGLGIGLTGNRGAIEGANQGAGIGAGIGALAGFAIPGVGPILGSMAGGLVGQAAGGLFGGLFGDGESPGPANDTGPLSFRSGRGFGGPFGNIALGNTEREFRGPLTQMVRQFDQGVAEFLTGRQEAAIAARLQALPEFSGRFPESDPSAAFLQIMRQRAGVALQGAGISAASRGRILGGAGSAEDISARVGEALQLFQQITDLRLGPVRAQFATLDRQFDEQITTARRLGLSTSELTRAHQLAREELTRQIQLQQVSVAVQVGAITPLSGALRTLKIQMQEAEAQARALGISTANVDREFARQRQALIEQDRLQRQQEQEAAREAAHQARLKPQQVRLQRSELFEQVGIFSPLERALKDLDIRMTIARIEAERLGISTAFVAREQNRLAAEIKRQHKAQIDTLALSIVEPFQELLDPLKEFSKDLQFDNLNPLGQIQAAETEFRRIAALAQAGSTTAIQQLQGAGEAFISQSERFGASPAGVSARSEVLNVTQQVMGNLTEAQREASAGLEDVIRVASRRQIDTTREVVEELRLVKEEIKRLRR